MRMDMHEPGTLMSIDKIAVIGAGTMGNGIAQVCAVAGLQVTMVDVSDAAVQRGMTTLAGSLDRLVKKEKLTVSKKDAALARVHGSANYADLRGAALVIEAATENLDVKLRILKQIDELVAGDTVIATNTSSMSITQLAAVVSHPERFIGMHFFNPVPMMTLLRELAGLDELAQLPGCEEVTANVVDAILEEAGKFASGVLSPLNASGDQEGARWQDGAVITAAGWQAAYRQFVEGGWNALSCDPVYGGHGLPRLVSTLVEEMWNGANVSFALCPMLTRGAIEAIELSGTHELKHTYLPRLISGEWTGTMNLTEPQAGSDLAAVRTRAVPQGNGSYRIFGQKIFITYGEHDLTDNIIHLVLARARCARRREGHFAVGGAQVPARYERRNGDT